jgi:hypothetical protein
VVDQHRLLLEPVSPALLADLGDDALADRPREWRALEAGARLAAAGAGYFSGHVG